MRKKTLNRLTITPSTAWVIYFRDNANRQKEISWDEGSGVSSKKLVEIIPSLRGWQLGETSDGSHLLAAARDYAAKIGDPIFIEAVRWFIASCSLESRWQCGLDISAHLKPADTVSADSGEMLGVKCSMHGE